MLYDRCLKNKLLSKAIFLLLAMFFCQHACLASEPQSAQAAVPAVSNRSEFISLAQPPIIPKSSYLSGVTVYLFNFGSDELRRLAADGVVFSPSIINNHFELVSGNILISPDRDVVIKSANIAVQVSNGSTVFIVKDSDSLTIYDLHQKRPKQVFVSFDNHKLLLEPGELMVLTRHSKVDFQTLDGNCRPVIYKSTKSAVSSEGLLMHVFTANFSMTSAISNIAPLNRLLVSSNDQDRKFLAMLIRDAVIMGDDASEIEIPKKRESSQYHN